MVWMMLKRDVVTHARGPGESAVSWFVYLSLSLSLPCLFCSLTFASSTKLDSNRLIHILVEIENTALLTLTLERHREEGKRREEGEGGEEKRRG